LRTVKMQLRVLVREWLWHQTRGAVPRDYP